jgi:hypothetical protein
MVMSVELSVERKLAGETEVFGHFVHHKCRMICLGIQPGPPLWEANV